jgi:valyl-tRNA synthetase
VSIFYRNDESTILRTQLNKEEIVSLPKRYDPGKFEPEIQDYWQTSRTYDFSPETNGSVYAIDTPPATVSGRLHLGHVNSYSQTDFIARFWRMNGSNVFYPMGFDDNGLPTDRYVEKRLGITAQQIGRRAFIEKCLEVSDEVEEDYRSLWKRLGLSVDWRYSYRTIDDLSRRTSQQSFIDLYHKGLAYRREAPTIWCSECQTAVAQAELNDLERESEFVTLAFRLENGSTLPIATTRPELLPACVAVFVHPGDKRFEEFVGKRLRVPLLEFEVPILADVKADPEKGTGAVMCCTFGDVTDVEWWYTYNLPLKSIIGRNGKMNGAAGEFAGLTVEEARRRIIEELDAQGLLLSWQTVMQSVRVHERDDYPVEYIVTLQWFVRVLDFKKELLEAGEQVAWHPVHMKSRYREWVENLGWDWCVSRQRYFGVPIPVWYCDACGKILPADEKQLPVDPTDQQPLVACDCGSTSITAEVDVMDTWATSSMSPQIEGRWLTDKQLYGKIFPMNLRPQAHEIIRTWAFYTIVKSHHHFGVLPWKDIAISGWVVEGKGGGKLSKSRGVSMSPMEMITKYSVDAVRYWAASTSMGKDTTVSEEKIVMGSKLVTKLWNVAKFSQRFLESYQLPTTLPDFTPTDRWLLSRTQWLIQRVTELFRSYDYAGARSETESFFWRELADNYLEMSKERLYDETHEMGEGARYTLYHVFLTVIKLFAPILPYITETLYQALFVPIEGESSIHNSHWPVAKESLISAAADAGGEALIEIATAVRRYKSESNLSLGTELQRLQLATADASLNRMLQEARADIMSVTRAKKVEVKEGLDTDLQEVKAGGIKVGLVR